MTCALSLVLLESSRLAMDTLSPKSDGGSDRRQNQKRKRKMRKMRKKRKEAMKLPMMSDFTLNKNNSIFSQSFLHK